jgi:acylphosphatase
LERYFIQRVLSKTRVFCSQPNRFLFVPRVMQVLFMSTPKTRVQVIARRVLVSGSVQGVGYRAALCEKARELHVEGWCRNTSDGRVEAWLQGPVEMMDNLLSWMEQGPSAAQVSHLEIESQALLEPMLGESVELFQIRK